MSPAQEPYASGETISMVKGKVVGVNRNGAEAAREQVDAIYRSDSRRILVTLIRLLGDFDLAEEARCKRPSPRPWCNGRRPADARPGATGARAALSRTTDCQPARLNRQKQNFQIHWGGCRFWLPPNDYLM